MHNIDRRPPIDRLADRAGPSREAMMIPGSVGRGAMTRGPGSRVGRKWHDPFGMRLPRDRGRWYHRKSTAEPVGPLARADCRFEPGGPDAAVDIALLDPRAPPTGPRRRSLN